MKKYMISGLYYLFCLFLILIMKPTINKEKVLPSTVVPPVVTEIKDGYFLGDTSLNHVIHEVKGSVIIPFHQVTDFQVRTKENVPLYFRMGDKEATVRIPKNTYLKHLGAHDDGWVKVSYLGYTGYLREDLSKIVLIPVIFQESSEWAEIQRTQVKNIRVRAAENAMLKLMTPYEWGAEGPVDYDRDGDAREGYDCSGLLQWAFFEEGLLIPRTTATGYNRGMKVERKDIEVGDLIYFNPKSSIAPVSHVGIYLGDNMMLHATKVFGMTGISEVYWDRMVSIVRFGE